MKNRYLLFSGDRYYPVGGAHDLKGAYPTKIEAMQDFNDNHASDNDWAHIFDLETNTIVRHYRENAWQ